MEDDDRESNASSDREQDDAVEEVDDRDNDGEHEDEDADGQNDGDGDEEDDGEGDKTASSSSRTNGNSQQLPDTKLDPSTAVDEGEEPKQPAVFTHDNPFRPVIVPGVLSARTYDIIPTMAAPMSTSINALAVTPDLRYWMTGGNDCYIRKHNGPDTINGKLPLTVAQRHSYVDTVHKAGVLMSYWGNEEPPIGAPAAAGSRAVEEPVLSPVYSLAVHSQALWLLAGCESGAINLQSVRYDEGKRIHCLQKHTNAVSVLQLAPDEHSVLSGSWDKTILDWDLENGAIKRTFQGNSSQISAIELRPLIGAPIPAAAGEELVASDTFSSSNNSALRRFKADTPDSKATLQGDSTSVVGSVPPAGEATQDPTDTRDFAAPAQSPAHESLFGGSDAGSLFGDNNGSGGGGGGAGFSGGDDDYSMNAFADTSAGDLEIDGLDHTSDGAIATHLDAPPPLLEIDGPAPDVPEVEMQGAENSSESAARPSSSHRPLSSAGLSLSQQPPPSPGLAPPLSAKSPRPSTPTMVVSSPLPPQQHDPTQVSADTFLSASIDGTLRIWDKRVPNPFARIKNQPQVPPWCMGACWSPDGNWIYAGRRNGTVEEYSIHKATSSWAPQRSLRFPNGSGPVSAVRSMPNGRHLVCASHDILRLYDITESASSKHSSVPFLIIPGAPRPGVTSHVYLDPTYRFMISTAGTRGWEGSSWEALVGYEILTMA